MNETVLSPEMTDEQYQLEIADMMARVQTSNDESARRRAEIDEMKLQSRMLMADIETALRRRENRSVG